MVELQEAGLHASSKVTFYAQCCEPCVIELVKNLLFNF